MRKSTKIIALIGLTGKGAIHLLIGVLTLLAALNLGGTKSGKSQAFAFLDKQSYGQALLVLIAVSLVCYATWLFVQGLWDPENKRGKGWMAKAQGLGMFFSTMAYLFFAFLAIQKLFNAGSSGGSGKKLQLLPDEVVTVFFVIAGITLAVSAISFFVRAFQGNFLDKFNTRDLKLNRFMRSLGYFGLYSRFFVVGVLSFSFFQKAFGKETQKMNGTKKAFAFLQEWEYGSIVMGIAAAGLISYGIFFMMLSRYRDFDD
jgi:hypothetical protein